MAEVLLDAEQIGKDFGGLTALDRVSLQIQRGEIYGLIGPNGAGKTTLFNLLTGLYRLSRGQIRFEQQSIGHLAPHQIVERGIARTFQNIRLFASMTALENVLVGQHVRSHAGLWAALFRTRSMRAEEQRLHQRAYLLLEQVGLDGKADRIASQLSYGDQRRLEIARALATSPKLLALDEPAAGMNSTETASLKLLIQQLRGQGLTILLIEHDVKLIMNLCDRVSVLNQGQKLIEDIPSRVQQDPQVIAAYLGTPA